MYYRTICWGAVSLLGQSHHARGLLCFEDGLQPFAASHRGSHVVYSNSSMWFIIQVRGYEGGVSISLPGVGTRPWWW